MLSIWIEDFFNQAFKLRRIVVSSLSSAILCMLVWKLIFAILYFSEQIALKSSIIWEFTCDQTKQNTSKCPNIGSMTRIFLFFGQIWTHIVRCTTSQSQFLVRFAASCKSKINEFDHFPFIVNQNIFKFQISVYYPIFVHVGNN